MAKPARTAEEVPPGVDIRGNNPEVNRSPEFAGIFDPAKEGRKVFSLPARRHASTVSFGTL